LHAGVLAGFETEGNDAQSPLPSPNVYHCTAYRSPSLLSCSSVPVTPLLQLQAARVIPDVVNGVASPAENLTITYGGVYSVRYGNELTINQTQAAPIVNVINVSA
jgi:hypothetical protein